MTKQDDSRKGGFGAKVLFNPGRIVMTRAIDRTLSSTDIVLGLYRHLNGDWGDIDEQDRELNELRLRDGGRLLSVYRAQNGVVFWIITKADRSCTKLLLPDE